MAIALDATTAGPNTTATSATFSHTVSGSNRFLVVGVGYWASGGTKVNSVTYNGVAMTQIAGGAHDGANGKQELWGLIAPATGANNVVVTFAASCEHAVGATSYTGVHQSTPIGLALSALANDAAPTLTLTDGATGQLVHDIISAFQINTTAGANQTERWDNANGTGQEEASVSEEAGGSSITMSWTLDFARNWGQTAVQLIPTDGTAPLPPYYVGAGTAAFTNTASATVTPTLPVGWAANDIHVLVAAGSNNTDWPEPSGWTKISPSGAAENNTAAQRVECWVRRAVGGDADPVLSTYTGTTVRGARIFGVRGCPTTGNAEDQIAAMSRSNNAASATVTFATITPTEPMCLLVAAYAYEDDPQIASLLGTNWSQHDADVSALGTDMALGMDAHRVWPADDSATGALTSTVSVGTFANSVNVGLLFAFKPIPAAAGVTVDLTSQVASLALSVVAPTVVLGSITLNLTSVVASLALSTVNPTVVLGSITLDLTTGVATAVLTTVDPSVILGSITLDLTTGVATVALSTVDPTVLGGDLTIDLSGAPNSLALSVVNPSVVLGSLTLNLTTGVVTLALSTVDPTVLISGGGLTLDLTGSPNSLALSVVNPTVVLGSIVIDLAGVPITLALTTVDPTILAVASRFPRSQAGARLVHGGGGGYTGGRGRAGARRG